MARDDVRLVVGDVLLVVWGHLVHLLLIAGVDGGQTLALIRVGRVEVVGGVSTVCNYHLYLPLIELLRSWFEQIV